MNIFSKTLCPYSASRMTTKQTLKNVCPNEVVLIYGEHGSGYDSDLKWALGIVRLLVGPLLNKTPDSSQEVSNQVSYWSVISGSCKMERSRLLLEHI